MFKKGKQRVFKHGPLPEIIGFPEKSPFWESLRKLKSSKRNAVEVLRQTGYSGPDLK